jgi:hypothetical protein
MKKFSYIFLALAVGAVLYFLYARQEAEQSDTGRLAFALHVEAFKNALVNARSRAMRTGEAVAVDASPNSWSVHTKGGSVVKAGSWVGGERLGTNIPGGRFYFDGSGACRTEGGAVCASDDAAQPEHVAHALAIASEVHSIYTITFGADGEPLFWNDEF